MKKFAIVYGRADEEIQKRAIEELSCILLEYTLTYPVCCSYDDALDLSECTCIYVGTKQNNAYIREHSRQQLVCEEAYAIQVENNTVIIEGYDDAGVLYGVLDFYNQYIVKFEHPDTDAYWVNFLEKDTLPDFAYTGAPSIKERGLWTWGHVIYDYKGYLDHMMKLKMNRIIIWNDFAPTNAADIIRYAHARNIKVIWGFSWLWATNCGAVDIKHLDGRAEEIFETYEKEYAGIGGDGIYFQTFTELHEDRIDGVSIAQAATAFVNRTAALFYDKYPDIQLQFGLHATSVKHELDVIKTVDPRIHIIWEDCGAFPFAYVPTDVLEFESTKQFVCRAAKLRGEEDRFGVVTKGLVKLDWTQFEHATGPQCIGVSTEAMKKNRVDRKARIWRYIQACWLTRADKAQEMVQTMYRAKDGQLSVFALVEDGMFEENIIYPVALYAEMLWDSQTDVKTMMKQVALRSYVRFA